MPATLRVYSHAFEPLEDFISVEYSERNFILNGIGQASFKVPLRDAKTKKNIIRPGNMVKIHSEYNCPDWYGQIADYSWEDDDSISVTCNSRESLLNGIAFEGKITSTHDIAEQIDKFTHDSDTRLSGITLGDIYSATLDEADTITASGKFTDAISQLAELLDAEWMVHPTTGQFDFVKKIGKDKSNEIVIEQGRDVLGFPKVSVNTSNLIWYCKVIAPNQDSEETRFGEYRDEELRNWLGGDVRQEIIHESTTQRGSTLEQKAKAEVEKRLGEVFVFDFSIGYQRPHIIKSIEIGDTVTVDFSTVAWSAKGKVRIHGLAVNEKEGDFRLVVKPVEPRQWLRHFTG